MHIFRRRRSLSPQAQVESCWHFHPFNHRLLEMLWEIPAGWRSRSEWDGLSPSRSPDGLSVTYLWARLHPSPDTPASEDRGVGSFILYFLKVWFWYPPGSMGTLGVRADRERQRRGHLADPPQVEPLRSDPRASNLG